MNKRPRAKAAKKAFPKLLLAQDEGNRVLAQELYDVFSQELAAISMEIASLKMKADQAPRLIELGRRISDLARRLHQTSRDLHPSVLEDLGLARSLRQECESFQSASGISTSFVASKVRARIPQDLALCLYRVAQESLRNIRKHARETKRVRVSLSGGRGGITLTVKDDGDGFELHEALLKGGLGLISMDERIRVENGELTIQSKPGKGTRVNAFVPLALRKKS